MGVNLIKSPHQKGNCLHSVNDCLEIVVESTDLIQDKGAKERACFQINAPLEVGDRVIFFEGTDAQITFEVVEASDIGGLKCRRIDYVCLPVVQTLTAQVELLIEELGKRPVFADSYNITLIEIEGENPIVCLSAKKIGKLASPLAFTDKAIVSPSGAITTNIEGYPNQTGADIVLLDQYETTFYIYCKEVTVTEGGVKKEWKQVFKSPPRPYFITKEPFVRNEISYEIQEAVKAFVWSEFKWDANNQSIAGLHLLNTLTKEIEVRASTKYKIQLNDKVQEVESNILPLGARFRVVNASLPPWASGFLKFCDCLGQLDGMDTRLFSMYPDGLEVADCGIIPIQAFVCVPSTGKAAGESIGAWYVDVFWQDGTVSTSIKLADIDIKESTVVQYNLDLKNDAAITTNLPDLQEGCLPPIDYFNTYLVINAEGNPLDFTASCQYNEGNEDYNIVFVPFGLEGFGNQTLQYEWALSQEGETWEVFSTSQTGVIDMDADEILARIVRLRVTTPLEEGCVLEVQRDMVAGGCRVWSGFELETAYTGNASLCPDFEQNSFTATLQSQGDKWVAFFDIGDIVTEINFSNTSNKFIQHGVSGNYTNSKTFLLEDIPIGSTIDYEVTISYEYDGNLIVRTFKKTYTAPDGAADITETLPCEDTTGDTGVSIDLIDNSIGGGQITSKKHYYAFAPKTWDFESQVKEILQEYDFEENPLTVSYNSQYFFSSSMVLWIAQIIEGCNGEKYSYRQVTFECELPTPQYLIAGNCKGLNIEVTSFNAKDGKPPRIYTSAVENPNGHHDIRLLNDTGQVIALVQSTEENTRPILDTYEVDGLVLTDGNYTVQVVTADNCSIKRTVNLFDGRECLPPAKVLVQPTKEGKAFVQWTEVETAVYYRVRYKREDAPENETWKSYFNREWFASTNGNPTSNNVFIDKKFDNCGLYLFEVTAVCEGDGVSAPAYSEVTEMYCCDPCTDPCKNCDDSVMAPVLNPIAPPLQLGEFEVYGVMQCGVIPVAGDFEVSPVCQPIEQSSDFEVSPVCEEEEIQNAGVFEVRGVCSPDTLNCDEDWSVSSN